MKKLFLVVSACFALGAGASFAAHVVDWHDLDAVHTHVLESIHEMERARKANHYDMDGHGAKAEGHLREAERELHLAVESAKRSH